jgi:hypothetical protein
MLKQRGMGLRKFEESIDLLFFHRRLCHVCRPPDSIRCIVGKS